LVSVDFFTVPTATLAILIVFMVLHHDRRRIVHISVTAQPTDFWAAQQIRETFPWDTGPPHLIRDRDGFYGATFRGTVAAMDTVHDDADFAREALAAGALGYVIKQRMASDLIAAIKEAHTGRSFVSPLSPPQTIN
jgi:hypothetical protein